MMPILNKIKNSLGTQIKWIILLNSIWITQFSFAEDTGNFEGLWQEITLYDDSEIIEGEGAISVDEADYFLISKFNDKLLINSVVSPDFSISHVELRNHILKFTMLNSMDPDEIYVLKYQCYELVKNKELKCQFSNQKGQTEKNIFWKKRTQILK